MDTWSIVAIVISGAALLFSIIGPLITAVIKNRYDSKMYERRFYNEHRHEVIENYLKCLGKCLFAITFDATVEFGEATAEIFMYVPKEMWENIRKLNQGVTNMVIAQYHSDKKTHADNLRPIYFQLCEQFSELGRAAKKAGKRK